jgi:Mal s 1 allergenic protein-like
MPRLPALIASTFDLDPSGESRSMFKSQHRLSHLAALLLIAGFAQPPAASAQPVISAAGPITHSFFIAGPNFTGVIGEQGEVVWDSGQPGARDGFVLPDGHILICWSNVVREYDADKQVVFTYQKDPSNQELGTAVRLENGLTMITELGGNPRIIEVDAQGRVQTSVPLQPETDNAHMQTRMARKLPNGNYLVPHLLAFAVKEYTPTGEVVKTFRTDRPELGGREAENWPFTAIRLDNGHTLIDLTHGNKTIEVDKNGDVAWTMSNADVEGNVFQDACGAQRLPNGHTVIASYAAREGVKLFEVTPEKEIVWMYDGPYRVHEFQILTTNGQPLEGRLLK